MQITLLHVADCPNLYLIRERLAVALAELGIVATITDRRVTEAAEAATPGFAGSPTILADGADPFAAPDLLPHWPAGSTRLATVTRCPDGRRDGTIIAARRPTLRPTVHEPDVRLVVSG